MRVDANGLGFELLDEGEGPAVLLLHGFPDTHRVWREQLPALLDAGYRVIAPDLRGRGASDMPEAVEAYNIATMLGDVTGIMDARGVERAFVVGHDFGAVLAWATAILLPDRVEKLVAMSVGNPAGWREPPLHQRMLSWYMLFFQFEGIAEAWLQHDDWKLLREWLADAPDRESYVEDLARPGRLTAGLNYYRANLAPRMPDEWLELPPVRVPTMGMWSTRDFALTEEQMTGSGAMVEAPWRYERVEDAGHWLQLEQPGRVNPLLLDFLKE